MATKKKTLEPLRRSLPSYPPKKVVDEFGDDITPGFGGNVSQSPKFITDGHVLLLRSAVPPDHAEIKNAEDYGGKKPTEASILAVWQPAEKRGSAEASFIGCAEVESVGDVAVIRDSGDRIVLVNPHLLQFCIHHLRPHGMRVALGPKYFGQPVSFHKDAALVGLLMPMRVSAQDVASYDLTTAPIRL